MSIHNYTPKVLCLTFGVQFNLFMSGFIKDKQNYLNMNLKFFKSISKILWILGFSLVISGSIAYGLPVYSSIPYKGISQAKSSTVYITPNGKCYHSSPNCPTLHKSKNIKAIEKSEAMKSRRACKVCH